MWASVDNYLTHDRAENTLERLQTEKIINELVASYERVVGEMSRSQGGEEASKGLEAVADGAARALEGVLLSKSESDKLSRILYLSMKNLAAALEARGRHHKALEYALRAYKLDTSNTYLLYQIGKLALDVNDTWTCQNTALRAPKRASECLLPTMRKRLSTALKNHDRRQVCLIRDVPGSLALLRGSGGVISKEFLPLVLDNGAQVGVQVEGDDCVGRGETTVDNYARAGATAMAVNMGVTLLEGADIDAAMVIADPEAEREAEANAVVGKKTRGADVGVVCEPDAAAAAAAAAPTPAPTPAPAPPPPAAAAPPPPTAAAAAATVTEVDASDVPPDAEAATEGPKAAAKSTTATATVTAVSSRARRERASLERGSRYLIKEKYEDDVELTSSETMHNLLVALHSTECENEEGVERSFVLDQYDDLFSNTADPRTAISSGASTKKKGGYQDWATFYANVMAQSEQRECLDGTSMAERQAVVTWVAMTIPSDYAELPSSRQRPMHVLPQPSQLREYILDEWRLLRCVSPWHTTAFTSSWGGHADGHRVMLYSECILDVLLEADRGQKPLVGELGVLLDDLVLTLLPCVMAVHENSPPPSSASSSLAVRRAWLAAHLLKLRFSEGNTTRDSALPVIAALQVSAHDMGDKVLRLWHVEKMGSIVTTATLESLIVEVRKGDKIRALVSPEYVRGSHASDAEEEKWFRDATAAITDVKDVLALFSDSKSRAVCSGSEILRKLLTVGTRVRAADPMIALFRQVLASIEGSEAVLLGTAGGDVEGILRVMEQSCEEVFNAELGMAMGSGSPQDSDDGGGHIARACARIIFLAYERGSYKLLSAVASFGASAVAGALNGGDSLLKAALALVLDLSLAALPQPARGTTAANAFQLFHALSDMLVRGCRSLQATGECAHVTEGLVLTVSRIMISYNIKSKAKVRRLDLGSVVLMTMAVLHHPNGASDAQSLDKWVELLCHCQKELHRHPLFSSKAAWVSCAVAAKLERGLLSDAFPPAVAFMALSTLGQIYHDLYGLPALFAPLCPCLMLPVDARTFGTLFRFIMSAETNSLCPRASLRAALEWINALPVGMEASVQEQEHEQYCEAAVHALLFGSGRPERRSIEADVGALATLAEHATSSGASQNEQPHKFHGAELEEVGVRHVRREITRKMAEYSSPEAGSIQGSGESLDILARVERRTRQAVEVCMQDLFIAPMRFQSWWRILVVLVDLSNVCMDTLADLELPDELPSEWHVESSLPSLELVFHVADAPAPPDESSAPKPPKPTSFVLCVQIASVLELVRRAVFIVVALVEVSVARDKEQGDNEEEEDDEEEDDMHAMVTKAAEALEIYGSCLYVHAHHFRKGSVERKNAMANALANFDAGLAFTAAHELPARHYTLLMSAKLSFQQNAALHMHGALQHSLSVLNGMGNISHSSFKTLRLAERYQIHTMRTKACVALLTTLPPHTDALWDLLRSTRFDGQTDATQLPIDHRSTAAEGVSLLLDALNGLRACRKLDAHEPKCMYRIARTIHAVATLRTTMASAEPGPWAELETLLGAHTYSSKAPYSFTSASALAYVHKLFDKKRQQIAAIWCQETASTPFDRLLQRTVKFDAYRRKFLSFYVVLLRQCQDWTKAAEILSYCHASRCRTASVQWMTKQSATCLAEVVAVELVRRESRARKKEGVANAVALNESYGAGIDNFALLKCVYDSYMLQDKQNSARRGATLSEWAELLVRTFEQTFPHAAEAAANDDLHDDSYARVLPVVLAKIATILTTAQPPAAASTTAAVAIAATTQPAENDNNNEENEGHTPPLK